MDSQVEGHVVGAESLKEADGGFCGKNFKFSIFKTESCHDGPEQDETQRATVTSTKGRLTLDELLEAEVAIIHYCQKQRFSEEIAALFSGSRTVSRRSPIYRLDPVWEDDVLRVGGRLSSGAMPEEAKHPLILSKDQHIATLILRHVHQQLGHGGRAHTLSKVRKRVWITSANTAVRKFISECSVCCCHNGRAVEQKMADLPLVRILPDLPPFTNTEVDYVGPIEVRRGRSTCKRYGVLFKCMASRAVHLEVAASLDTDACINALRRFISRRGQVAHLTSDNGTNFRGADVELKKALTLLNQDRMEELCHRLELSGALIHLLVHTTVVCGNRWSGL